MGQAVSCVLGRLQPVKCTGAQHVGRRGLRKQTSQECLWCNTNKACLDYPVTSVLPPASLCKLSSARWGVCWVNFEALIITMSVVGGTLLLGIAICCCCCCRRKRSRKPDRSEEKAMREREERRIRQEERRAEMKTRHDEIRKKYGLFKEENPYARFENN
uniref:PTTG1 interacting protein n=1 Tax=Gorilla gorilla gorilla TaxID=9595 RepID=A0A2I2YAY7_GORGO